VLLPLLIRMVVYPAVHSRIAISVRLWDACHCYHSCGWFHPEVLISIPADRGYNLPLIRVPAPPLRHGPAAAGPGVRSAAEHGGTAKAPGASLPAGAKRRQYYRQRAAVPEQGAHKQMAEAPQTGRGRAAVCDRLCWLFYSRPAPGWMHGGRGVGRWVKRKGRDKLP